MQKRDFSTQEILEGLDYINQTLTQHGLPLMTLDEYKESLKYPISDELLPRFPASGLRLRRKLEKLVISQLDSLIHNRKSYKFLNCNW